MLQTKTRVERDSFTIVRGESPLVAAAVHDGHEVRPEVARLLLLSDRQRRREEDPFTGMWTKITDSRIVARRSRFEVDLNRPRRHAVYRRPEDAWGLDVWKAEPPDDLVERSLAEYDAFYDAVEEVLLDKMRRHDRFVVYDLHSYPHRRSRPEVVRAPEGAPVGPDDSSDRSTNGDPDRGPDGDPDVRIGTGSLNRARWAPVVDRLVADLRSVDFLGRRLDVREDVTLGDGEFPAWVNRQFPASGCAIELEFRKFFLDKWTEQPSEKVIRAIEQTLRFAAAGTLDVLATL